MYDKLIDLLTDNYNKRPESNIGKLFKIMADELQLLQDTFTKIEDYRDIDNAVGYALDKTGSNFKQYRGTATDEIYRALIKSKIQRNLSDGSIDRIIEIVSYLLNIDPSEVVLTQTYNAEPASLQVNVPSDAINNLGLTLYQFGQIVDVIAAGGVRAASLFEGTFAFSSQYDASETDTNTGLADDAQITGGTLGAYFDPGTNVPLPL